ncbi:MAG TPA: hypothetical protein VES67_02370 [Vicinamibacterales bacterium]|nr:hypothetical protein [Vicinamibacterales bacterium]
MCEAAGFQGEVRDTGKQVIAGRSGHHIHIDQPELVVDVIREVVAKARK